MEQPWNNPHLSPFLGLAEDQALSLGPVPDETNTYDAVTGDVFTPQGPNNMLAALRAQFPYLPIIPFPTQVRTVVLTQNIVQNIRLPDMVSIFMLRGSADYFVSRDGNAEIPIDATSHAVYKPDGIAFYGAGIKELSLITNVATGCIVTLLGYTPSELPRYG